MRQRGLALVGEEDEEVLAFNDLVSAWAGFFERKMGHERLRRCSSFAHLSDKCLRLQQELIAQVFFGGFFFFKPKLQVFFRRKTKCKMRKQKPITRMFSKLVCAHCINMTLRWPLHLVSMRCLPNIFHPSLRNMETRQCFTEDSNTRFQSQMFVQ